MSQKVETPLTPEEFKNRMKDIRKKYSHNPVQCHALLDKEMCDLLESLGYGEGAHQFDKATRYYG